MYYGRCANGEFTIFAKTIMHPVYPPNVCITIVFDFSWDYGNSLQDPENINSLSVQVLDNKNANSIKNCICSLFRKKNISCF